MSDSHARLIAHLEAMRARFRVVEHQPEGRSEAIAIIRGNHPSQALKAMVIALKGCETEFALAVLPGDRRCDFAGLAEAFGARKARFAAPKDAQRVTGCVMGAVPPFTFDATLPLIADPAIQANEEVVFNAGRLDGSIYMPLADYLRTAMPRLIMFAP
jgi:Ala-tRNA(Pro) deacylase